MPYKTTEIVISGSLQGPIWWPMGAICTKSFTHKFHLPETPMAWADEWSGLRDALLRVTNDGDFSSCRIREASLQVTRTNGTTKRIRHRELFFDVVKDKDLFVPFDELTFEGD